MKKLISLFLVFMLLVTVVPFNALADTDEIEINVYSKIFKAFYNKSSNTSVHCNGKRQTVTTCTVGTNQRTCLR